MDNKKNLNRSKEEMFENVAQEQMLRWNFKGKSERLLWIIALQKITGYLKCLEVTLYLKWWYLTVFTNFNEYSLNLDSLPAFLVIFFLFVRFFIYVVLWN